MKKKINFYLVLTAFLTLAATLIIAVAIFHHMYREQIIDDMRTCAEVIGGMVSSGEELEQQYTEFQSDVRLTVISGDGDVLFDTETGSREMENHADRPEIQEAKSQGQGYSVRHSDTLNRDMYYYALLLENGDILRLSKEEDNIWSVFYNTMYGIVGIGMLMLLICFVLSRCATDSIVRPIERLAADLDNAEDIDIYEELIPFVTTIRQQHNDIIKSSRMRQEFTANVSHELKTPLTSISGYAELIETGIAGENEVQRFAGEIHRNAKRLLTLINDIIQLSELDGGHAEITRGDVDLLDVAKACVETLRVNAENHGIHIECFGGGGMVWANRDMMEELVFNLCDNAIRYNRPGGWVHVTVERVTDQTVLTVQDTGIGIPKESQERVFERFYRVDKSRSKSTGGTGLGLAIVKHIVSSHDAQLELESEAGAGTTMRVIFPDREGSR